MTVGAGERGRRSFTGLLFEVVLITVGVFLALWTSNWNEDRQHRARATDSLRNFLVEIESNRDLVKRNREYHETLSREVAQFLRGTEPPTEERFNKEIHFEGVRPVMFERTAWDLALATQALAYLQPDLAFDIARVYTQQGFFETLQNSFLGSAFTPASMAGDNMKGLASAMLVYLGDVNVHEPAILQSYEKIIPEIKQALKESGQDLREKSID